MAGKPKSTFGGAIVGCIDDGGLCVKMKPFDR